ncbi:serine hydrolase-domain-containing protein [Xylariaceae sp. FL0016]|nr:serine hydrolase-domain-containing protein [Xylariaceae sp. FL0016]
MLRNVRQPKPKKPVMLMFHGSGSSAAIFRIQTHGLARELSKSFDLVYLDGPMPSAPGPGVLPLFADMPSYHRWLTPGNIVLSPAQRLAELLDVARYVQAQLDDQGVKASDVVSILGFSQGALVAMAMLGLRLAEQSFWENLRFCTAVGACTTGDSTQLDGIETMVTTLSGVLGRPDGKFPGYMVQAAGVKDLWYKDAKRISNMCAKDRTKTMDYRDGHVVPRQRAEILKLVQMILATDRSSKEAPHSNELENSWISTVPSILEGGNLAQGMTVLAQNGIVI